jgi:quinol monooxygenase YgiN
MPKTTIRVVAHIATLPDKVEEVKSVLLRIIEPTRQEDGCIVYELLQNQKDSTDFTFVEEWESQELLNAHPRLSVTSIGGLAASEREE